MDAFILSLAIRWLPAVDALAASCVSRYWKAALALDRDGGELWKQVCQNTNKFVTEQLSQNTNMDYRRLALGFGRSMPVAPRRLSPPTLGPDDIFAVVDLYRRAEAPGGKRRRVIEASWACSIEYPKKGTTNIRMNNGGKRMVIHGANPYSTQRRNCKEVKAWQTARSRYSQKSPLHFAAYDVVGVNSTGENISTKALRARVTLFRKDTMKSVCVMDEDIIDCATGGDTDPAEEVVRFYYHNKDTLRFGNDKAGQNARLLAKKRAFSRFSLDGEFLLKATLPPPGSDEEYSWLANSRHAVRTMADNQVYRPDEKDKVALSTIPSFEYEVKRFAFAFRVSTDMPFDFWDEFDCQDDMMIALEGLGWQ
jgi:hypothetical protein